MRVTSKLQGSDDCVENRGLVSTIDFRIRCCGPLCKPDIIDDSFVLGTFSRCVLLNVINQSLVQYVGGFLESSQCLNYAGMLVGKPIYLGGPLR